MPRRVFTKSFRRKLEIQFFGVLPPVGFCAGNTLNQLWDRDLGFMTHLREIEKALFDAARNVADPVVRQALLDQTCNGNPALRTRIETLLTVQEPSEEFFTVHELKAEAAETPGAGARST